jgi:hypothetical protein
VFSRYLLLEALVETRQALKVAARFANEDFLAGQIVERFDRRAVRAGDDDFLDAVNPGLGEINGLPALGGDCQSGHDDVAASLEKRRDDLVARDGACLGSTVRS